MSTSAHAYIGVVVPDEKVHLCKTIRKECAKGHKNVSESQYCHLCGEVLFQKTIDELITEDQLYKYHLKLRHFWRGKESFYLVGISASEIENFQSIPVIDIASAHTNIKLFCQDYGVEFIVRFFVDISY